MQRTSQRRSYRRSSQRTLRRSSGQRVHWRKYGTIRPSAAGIAAIVFAAGFWFMGLLLDDRALMAAAVAVTLAFCCSLLLAVVQWRLVKRYGVALIDDRRGRVVPPQSAMPIIRLLLPRTMRIRSQYERLNQDDQVVSRMVGGIDGTRGLYRRASVFVRWHDPFGLWSASRVLQDRSERIMLPDVPERPASGQRMADQRLQGLTQSESTGGVRAYTPGDPPKLISWKATAHRGELMTRETGRDIRVSTIVVLDARSAGITDAQIDAQVEQVLPLLESTSMDCRLIVTDGVRFADNAEDCARLLAAMSPIVADAAMEEIASAEPDRLAAHVAEIAVRQTGVVGVRLLTPHPQGALAGALRQAIGADRLRVVEAAASPVMADTQPSASSVVMGAMPSSAIIAGAQPSLSVISSVQQPSLSVISRVQQPSLPVISSGGAAGVEKSSQTRQRAAERKISRLASLARNDKGTVLVSRALTAAALLVFFALSVTSLTGLIAATGYWPWFAFAALAIVAVETNIPSRSILRYAIRTASIIVATLATAAVLVIIRIHDISRLWLFDSAAFRRVNEQAVANAARNATGTVTSVQQVTPFGIVQDILDRGFNALDSQLPPITVDKYGDIILILAVALAVIVIRLILIARRTAPAFAVPPVVLFASNYALIGRQTDWWKIALVTAMFLLALWQTRPERTFAPTPAVVTALVTAITLALTTPAVGLAEAVPMSFGDSTGLLSANTINPMIDLKRSLQTGSDSTVLTYRAAKRTYLRMTTLDDFNGDTWSFDEALAKDANLYGSGIQLGLDSSNIMTDDDRYRNVDNPLSYYLYMGYLGMYGTTANGGAQGSLEYDPTGSGSGADSGSGSADGGEAARFFGSSEYTDMTSITIETLSSRFLPVPGVTNSLMNGIGGLGGLGSDWYQAGSTIYSRKATTTQNMHYRALGIGLQPITSARGFSQIGDVHSIQQRLTEVAKDTTVPWSQRTAAREQAIASGLAERHGQWLVMPLEIHATGTAANVAEAGDEVVDKQGQPVASVSGISGYIGRDGTNPTPVYSLEFSDSFLARYGIGTDESIGVMYGESGSVVVAMIVDEPDVTADDTGDAADGTQTGSTNDDGSSTDNPSGDVNEPGGVMGAGADRSTMRWYMKALTQLHTDLGYEMLSISDNESRTVGYARSALSAVQKMDRDVASRYRTLPDDLPANVTALVRQAQTDGVAIDGDGYDHQVAAMRWLVDYFTNPANDFVYSLNAPDGNGRSNLAVINDFLDSRSGYCTHYASALAVLGRAMGVPTRMVMGYNAGVGKANADGEFEVAAKQLHAWVDAYIDGVGWVPFDVTPATSENGSAAEDGTASDDTNGSAGDSVTTTITPDSTGTETNGNGSDSSDTSSSDAQDETDTDGSQSGDTSQSGSAAAEAKQARPWWNRLELPKWLAIMLWVLGGVLLLAGLAAIPAVVRALRRRRRLRLVAGAGSGLGAGFGDDLGAGGVGDVSGGPGADTGGVGGDISDAGAGGANSRAWLAAWSEICDTAWDAGVRWRPSDTERAIARRIADAIRAVESSSLVKPSDSVPPIVSRETTSSVVSGESGFSVVSGERKSSVSPVISSERKSSVSPVISSERSESRNLPTHSLTVIADQVTSIAFGVSLQPVESASGLRESVDTVLAELKTVQKRLPIHIRAKFLLLPPSLFHRQNR